MEFFTEEFKVNPYYPNYIISNLGYCINLKTKVKLYGYKNQFGYWQIKLKNKSGKFVPIMLSRLVLDTFAGPPPADGRIYNAHHINGNTNDNKIINLVYLPEEEHKLIKGPIKYYLLKDLFLDFNEIPKNIFTGFTSLDELEKYLYLKENQAWRDIKNNEPILEYRNGVKVYDIKNNLIMVGL